MLDTASPPLIVSTLPPVLYSANGNVNVQIDGYFGESPHAMVVCPP
jgi:hypothetical protein